MAKVQILLLIAALIAILNAYPLEDSSSTEEQTTDKNSYIEETFIEVLLPGLPQLNSTSINALLSTNNTIDKERLARDTSSSESVEDKSNEDSDDIDDKNSKEHSSEESHPGLVSAQVSASPRPLNRAARDISNDDTELQANVDENQNSSLSGSSLSSTAKEDVESKNSHPALLSASHASRDVSDENQNSATTRPLSTTEADVEKQKVHPVLFAAQASGTHS